MSGETFDFGHGVTGRFVTWEPDRDLNPQYEGIPDVERWGLILHHPDCHGSMVTFDGPTQRQLQPDVAKWTVESWDPLTLSPSILCSSEKGGCGLHGFIRDGRWVPA